jgi:hypothetical protein
MSSPQIFNAYLDDDAAREEHAAGERAEVDALIEQAESEWAAADRAEQARVSRTFTDQPRARRAHRRADRTVLRKLPDLLRPLGAPASLTRKSADAVELDIANAELRYVVDALACCLDENERLRGELDAANDAVWELLAELDDAGRA